MTQKFTSGQTVKCTVDPHRYPFWRDAHQRGCNLPRVGELYRVRGYVTFSTTHLLPSGATMYNYYVLLREMSNYDIVYSDQRRHEVAFPECWFTGNWMDPSKTYPHVLLLRDLLRRKTISKKLRVDTPLWDRRVWQSTEKNGEDQ
jgi:hypothetical protein